MAYFVWTKMQVIASLPLPQTIALKESERLAGDGLFWWGCGSPLDRNAIRQAAIESGGTLPAIFSLMISRPGKIDANPDPSHAGYRIWTQYEDAHENLQDIPSHVLEFSQGREGSYYALVCRSAAPLALAGLPFDPKLCKNRSGKPVGAHQVTSLVEGNIDDKDHIYGFYHFGFRATLVDPWFVKLKNPCPLESKEVQFFDIWKAEWRKFIAQLKTA
jgi:hypothetical protein